MAPQQSESRELDKVIVRLPDGMRDRLKQRAATNKRSMNAEIVSLLEAALTNAEHLDASLDEDPFVGEFLSGELAIAKAVGQKTGSPANVVFVARLMARTQVMQEDIDRKLEQMIALQGAGKGSPEAPDAAGPARRRKRPLSEGKE